MNQRPVSEEQCVEIRAALKNLHAESCSSGKNEGRFSIADMFRRGYISRLGNLSSMNIRAKFPGNSFETANDPTTMSDLFSVLSFFLPNVQGPSS